MQAFGYVRVSTEGQVVDGVSIDAQERRIRAWCEANGYELVGLFTDAGISGKRADNRPALQDALQAVCGERGAVLVVYSLSRLARSTKDTIGIAERLEKSGADLVSLTEKIDTTSAAGKMCFRLLAVLSEFERDLASERTTFALASKKSKGQRVGTIPVGYTLAADGVSLLVNDREQETLTVMRQLRGDGMTVRAIADELTRRGMLAKGGKPWKYGTVQRLLARG